MLPLLLPLLLEDLALLQLILLLPILLRLILAILLAQGKLSLFLVSLGFFCKARLGTSVTKGCASKPSKVPTRKP